MQSRKEELLERIRTKIRVTCDMPDLLIDSITFPDRVAQFKVMLQAVGGEAIELVQGENMQELICSRFPESKIIASNLPEISFATINPDQVDDPHELAYIDLAIIRGEIGGA
ncbi:MAG: hypothetical protein PHG27_10395, partial [Massilibacteroides sp.]|nr:hypothetical protein [Massilibacteroides sp.]